jgi:UDP-glucuronate 4-epimerase
MTQTSLVTGAAGFIGAHLCAALLARGDRVIGIDNFDPFYDRSTKLDNLSRIACCGLRRIELTEGDIRDAALMRRVMAAARPGVIYHLAALAGVRPSIADPARYVSVNLDGLVSILEAARAAGGPAIVFASSSSVYGNNRTVPFAETDPVDEPISPYAATKRGGELLCHAYAHLFGLKIAALRFFTVFGPAQRPDLAIAAFMQRIAEGDEVPMYGDGSTSRDYTYIDDIIAGVLAAPEALRRLQVAPGGVYRIWNLGGSHPVPLREMIDAVARVVGRPARVRPQAMQPGDVDRTFADLTRARAELGYQPHTPFEDGLRRQWAWVQGRMAISNP